MQQSPSWEANRFSASQEIPRILWNSKVYYRIPYPEPDCSSLYAHIPLPKLLSNFILSSKFTKVVAGRVTELAGRVTELAGRGVGYTYFRHLKRGHIQVYVTEAETYSPITSTVRGLSIGSAMR